MKRTFIAIDIPVNNTVKGLLNKLNHKLRNERIKWVEPEQYHITLQFLGNIDESLIDTIIPGLDKIAGNISGFSIILKEFGVFKNLKNPRILWIGFAPCKELEMLKYAIDEEMLKLGFEKSDKPFSAHLTIGRIKQLKDTQILKEWIDEHREAELQEIEVNEIIFYESILKSYGPEYIAIKRHSLRHAGN